MPLAHSPHAPMPDLTRSIKVNVTKIIAGKTKRTSTTLNYALCDFLFGRVLNPKIRSTMPLEDATAYRQWLTKQAQAWTTEQAPLSTQRQLETALIQAIYEHGVNDGNTGKLL